MERKAGDPLAARTLAIREARRLGTRPLSIEALYAALRKLADKTDEGRTRASPSRL